MTQNFFDIPRDAVPVTVGTDADADRKWLERFQYTDRHYRLFETYTRRIRVGHPNNEILFGVVLVDGNDIEACRTGIFSPSPSMIGHLNALPGKDSERHPERPLQSYRQVGGSYDAVRFGSDARFRIRISTIEENKISWRDIFKLPPIARCPRCKARLRTAQARQCFECGFDWH